MPHLARVFRAEFHGLPSISRAIYTDRHPVCHLDRHLFKFGLPAPGTLPVNVKLVRAPSQSNLRQTVIAEKRIRRLTVVVIGERSDLSSILRLRIDLEASRKILSRVGPRDLSGEMP